MPDVGKNSMDGYSSSDEEMRFSADDDDDRPFFAGVQQHKDGMDTDERRDENPYSFGDKDKGMTDAMNHGLKRDWNGGFAAGVEKMDTNKTQQSLFGESNRGFFSMPVQTTESDLVLSDSESTFFVDTDSSRKHDPLRTAGTIELSDDKEPLGCPCVCVPQKTVIDSKGFFDVSDCNAGLPTKSVSSGVMGLIQIKKLLEHFDRDTLTREFSILYSEDLKLNVSRQGSTESQLPDNIDKNRYGNINAYDITRVRLSLLPGIEHSDYINANWICGLNPDETVNDRSFIATQGPIPHTFQDFWRMIFEYNIKFIVFLGREIEKGMIKVDHYYPDVEPEKAIVNLPWENDPLFSASRSYFGGSAFSLGVPEKQSTVMTGPYMTITAVKEELTGISGVVKRTFLLEKTGEPETSREVYQYQYGGWPDNGAPASSEPIRNLVKTIISERGEDRAPVLVHCSAGVGRTGAFCTIYTHVQRILRYVQRQDEDYVAREGSPVKKARDDSSAGFNIPDTLRNSGSLLKTNLTASYGPVKPFHEDSFTCASPSTVSPLIVSSSSSFLDGEQPLTFNIFDTVLSLRRCRSGMVQNIDQYIFCYKAIIDELRLHQLLPAEVSSGSEEEDEKRSNSEIYHPPASKSSESAYPSISMKSSPFSSGRQSLLTSIDLGFLNPTPSEKPAETTSFDAEFHPSPTQEGSSVIKSPILGQSTMTNPLTTSTIHTNPLLQDSVRHSPLHPADSVHSPTVRSIPILQRTQSPLRQSPTLIAKQTPPGENNQNPCLQWQVGNGQPSRNNRSTSGNSLLKERGQQPELLTRSAITLSSSLLSTSVPAKRNPLLVGRSPGASPGQIFSPL